MDDKQLIEEYFDPTTSDSRKHEIEQVILTLPHSDSRRILFELGLGIQHHEAEENLKSRLQAIDELSVQRRSIWFKIAASILFFISVSFVLFIFLREGDSSHKVFEQYYIPYDGVVSSRSEANTFQEGLFAYKEGNYSRALEKLVLLEEPDGQTKLVLASCYLSLERWDHAIEVLSSIPDTDGQLIRDNRDWYLALAYLPQNSFDQAYDLLDDLEVRETIFSENARALLGESLFQEIKSRRAN